MKKIIINELQIIAIADPVHPNNGLLPVHEYQQENKRPPVVQTDELQVSIKLLPEEAEESEGHFAHAEPPDSDDEEKQLLPEPAESAEKQHRLDIPAAQEPTVEVSHQKPRDLYLLRAEVQEEKGNSPNCPLPPGAALPQHQGTSVAKRVQENFLPRREVEAQSKYKKNLFKTSPSFKSEKAVLTAGRVLVLDSEERRKRGGAPNSAGSGNRKSPPSL